MRYLLQKFAQLAITLLLVSLITFGAFSIIPGDPARLMLGVNASEEQVALLREELGLNQPLPLQYWQLLKGTLTGNMGKSVRFNIPVTTLIGQKLPVTLSLGLIALLMTLIFSFPLGLKSARKPGGIGDHLIAVLSHVFVSLPPFVIGLLLTLVLGLAFKWFVVGYYVPWQESPLGFMASLLVPAFAIALPKIAMTTKFLRASMLDEKKKDYVRTARSHGLSENQVLWRHVLPNALIPVLTVVALTAAEILGGSLIIERVFNLPGLGRLLLDAINGRDFPLIQGITLYLAAVVVLVHFFMDIFHSRIDPRIRLQ